MRSEQQVEVCARPARDKVAGCDSLCTFDCDWNGLNRIGRNTGTRAPRNWVLRNSGDHIKRALRMPKEVNGDHDNQDEAPAVVESGRAWLPPKDQKPRVDHGVAPANHSMQMNLESQSWAYVDATQFQVRGANYLSDKIKQPSKQNAFELVEVSGFSTLGKCMFSTERPDSFFSRARMMGRKNFIFTMHFNLDPMHVVMVYELNGDALEKVPFPLKTICLFSTSSGELSLSISSALSKWTRSSTPWSRCTAFDVFL